MLLALTFPAFAATIDLPVRALYTEYTDWGQDPTVVDDVRSASVAISNPDTGVAFDVDGELLLSTRTGAGTGEVTFDGNPNGSLRTWAIWLLDGNGKPLSAEPEVVDVLFGNDGDGTIVARASADIVVRTVRMKKRGVSRTDEDGTHSLQVVVQGNGINAAYVGIQELTTDGTPLTAHADMEAMTAGVYATYQGLVLDALVPLDTWKAQVDGVLSVDGVELDGDGQPTNADTLDFDLTWYGGPGTDGPTILSKCCRVTKIEALVIKQKRSSRVVLDTDDQPFDTYDGAVDVLVEGDARNVEVAGLLRPIDGVAPVTDILQVLDPSDVAILGTATATGKFPASPAAEPTRIISLRPVGEGEKALDDWRTCTLTPTAKSAVANSKTLRWTGECLRDSDLGMDIRNVTMKMTSTGATTLSAEVLGNEYQATTKLEFAVNAKELGLTTLSGAAAVDETSFTLPFVFPTDAAEGSYELFLQLYNVKTTPSVSLYGSGRYAWNETSSTVSPPKDGVSDAVKQAFLDDQKEKKK